MANKVTFNKSTTYSNATNSTDANKVYFTTSETVNGVDRATIIVGGVPYDSGARTTFSCMASDSYLTSQEKCSVRTEWASIQAEFEKHTANAKACWGDNPETDSTLAKDELWYSGYDNILWTIIEFDEKVVLQKISAIAPTRLWYKNQITSTQGNFGDDYSTKFTYPFTWTLNCDGIPIATSKYYAAQQIAMFFKESEDKDAVQHYISVYPKKQQYIHQINQVEIVQNTDGTYTTTVTITGYYEDPVYAIYLERYNTLKDYLENTAKLNEDSDTAITMQTYGSVKVNPFTKAFSGYYAASIELQNAIAARVAELEAQTAIDNLQIGGRNLLRGTATMQIVSGASSAEQGTWRRFGNITLKNTTETLNGQSVTAVQLINNGSAGGVCQDYFNKYEVGEDYTLSFWAKSTGTSIIIYQAAANGTIVRPFGDDFTDPNAVTTSWKRFSHTFTNYQGQENNNDSVVYINNTSPNTTVTVAHIKIEKGNKPTDWTPAPEDVEAEITEIKNNITWQDE